jgi:hypothetical protein
MRAGFRGYFFLLRRRFTQRRSVTAAEDLTANLETPSRADRPGP